MKIQSGLKIGLMCALLGLYIHATGQVVEQVKGKVIEILPGMQFAYGRMLVKLETDSCYFDFDPKYGKWVLATFKPGDDIEMKVRLGKFGLTSVLKSKKGPTWVIGVPIESILHEGEWVSVFRASALLPRRESQYRLFLEEEVRGDYFVNSKRAAITFDNGLVSFSPFHFIFQPINDVKRGDKISFMGYRMQVGADEGYVFPINPVNELFSFIKLFKVSGEIKSLLYKQNYACIGLAITTANGDARFSFPSVRAAEVEKFVTRHPSVTVYYVDFEVKDQLEPPELHALVSGKDTLKIEEFGFYGGSDGKHEHTPASVGGKISKINRSDKGVIISLIIGNDCYIEIDANTGRQLSSVIKKNESIEVEGDERIKLKGELYSRDLRIIVPKKITIDGKSYLPSTQP